MGDDEHGPAVIHEIRFKPFYGVHVEVVRGLVEKDDIRRGQKQPPESNPGFLAAGELPDAFSEFFFGKAETP